MDWLKDGQPIMIGHRFRPIHDFGYVALDIIDAISEDSGTYTCRATNLMGTCECNAQLTCQSKSTAPQQQCRELIIERACFSIAAVDITVLKV